MPAKRMNASATVSRSGSANGIGLAAAKAAAAWRPPLGRQRQDLGAIVHQRLVGLARAIPFEHGELGMMQGAALAVAEHVGEGENAPLAGRQQLLAGEFRRGVQIELLRLAVRPDQLGREGVQMRLVAGRDLQRSAFDLDEAARVELARSAAMRRARHRRGRRSAWMSGGHQGDVMAMMAPGAKAANRPIA